MSVSVKITLQARSNRDGDFIIEEPNDDMPNVYSVVYDKEQAIASLRRYQERETLVIVEDHFDIVAMLVEMN